MWAEVMAVRMLATLGPKRLGFQWKEETGLGPAQGGRTELRPVPTWDS